jgi:hypothetical protein
VQAATQLARFAAHCSAVAVGEWLSAWHSWATGDFPEWQSFASSSHAARGANVAAASELAAAGADVAGGLCGEPHAVAYVEATNTKMAVRRMADEPNAVAPPSRAGHHRAGRTAPRLAAGGTDCVARREVNARA